MGRDLKGRAGTLEWSVARAEGVVTVSLFGELDLASADTLGRDIGGALDENIGVLIVDLHNLNFIDSTGLRVLLRFKNHSEEAGRRLLIARVPGAVRRVLHVSGLVNWFEYLEGPPPGDALCPACDGWIAADALSCVHCGSAL